MLHLVPFAGPRREVTHHDGESRPVLQWERVVNNGSTTTNLLFLITDHLGTPVMTTPSISGPTWSDNRDPFGANSDNSLTEGT